MAKLNLENGQVKIFKNDFKEDGTKEPQKPSDPDKVEETNDLPF